MKRNYRKIASYKKCNISLKIRDKEMANINTFVINENLNLFKQYYSTIITNKRRAEGVYRVVMIRRDRPTPINQHPNAKPPL